MNFQPGDLYHVFNQGNNRQKIFFTRDNYLFFLRKIKQHILPHADILAWCLMPNHFHLMIYVHTMEVDAYSQSGENTNSDGFTNRNRTSSESEAVTSNTKHCTKRTLNDSIGILLRSYTRAINKQENMSGSLFRNPTHAECLTTPQGITPSFFNTVFGAQINVRIPEKEYPQACFNYIHQNPVKAQLVAQPEDWEFSSYPDYCGARNGNLINKERAKEFGLIL
jgi:putative transposase